ncbi:3-hydroxybutyryl-CoA dehydrogenase [bacterium]|nr:3-hydroxybutyryl-CoA dehydrogenase [bacterium]MBU1984679.1 3-hydroxybutyryl-CoA dehydrogenase [bacterium]
MSSSQLPIEPEFYPIERLLIAGPLCDAKGFADRASAAGHRVTLLLPVEEMEHAPKSYHTLGPDDVIGEDDFDAALELHCTDLEAKAETLYYLEDALAETVPILTLAMAISTGEITREMLVPERVLGVSLLPPFDESRRVELLPAPHTSRNTLTCAERLFESIGLKAIRIPDAPGGVLVRTVCCLVNEAALALQERVSSAEEIDLAMSRALGCAMGPLAWGDRIGLDRVLTVMEGLYAEYKEERYRPAPLLKQHVRAGYTGKKAGMGFFGN